MLPRPETAGMIGSRCREKRWCGREDSNFHGLPHSDLNAARLPIPPRPHRGRCRTMSGGAACSKRIPATQVRGGNYFGFCDAGAGEREGRSGTGGISRAWAGGTVIMGWCVVAGRRLFPAPFLSMGRNQKRPARTGRAIARKETPSGRSRESAVHVIAARAVAPKRVAPNEAVTNDTSANAISSFIAFFPNSKTPYAVYAGRLRFIRSPGCSLRRIPAFLGDRCQNDTGRLIF